MSNRVDRRRVLLGAAGAICATQIPRLMRSATAGEYGLGWMEDLPSLSTVYDEATGHHITGAILDHWIQHGRARVFGRPISEPINNNGKGLQFFENAVLTEDAAPISPPPDGDTVSSLDVLRDFREPTGVRAIDLGTMWLHARQNGEEPESIDKQSAFLVPHTGYGVHPEFWSKWLNEGGAFAWGYPLTWAEVHNGRLSQTFQRARFVLTKDGPLAQPLGHWLAPLWTIDTRPKDRRIGIAPYRAEQFAPDYGPVDERWVDIDTSKQRADFYVGSNLVYAALISSGIAATYTTPGSWNIFRRIRDERMIGDDGYGDPYDFSNVYFTQYFTWSWIGLHYCYWHDNFGTRQSHGCINMRLDDARWAWHFCSLDTKVVVHS